MVKMKKAEKWTSLQLGKVCRSKNLAASHSSRRLTEILALDCGLQCSLATVEFQYSIELGMCVILVVIFLAVQNDVGFDPGFWRKVTALAGTPVMGQPDGPRGFVGLRQELAPAIAVEQTSLSKFGRKNGIQQIRYSTYFSKFGRRVVYCCYESEKKIDIYFIIGIEYSNASSQHWSP